MQVNFNKASYKRTLAKEAELALKNRFFEEDPVLNEFGTAMLARPGSRKFADIGEGPIRAVYSEPGSFDDALFVVSGQTLFRYDSNGAVTNIGDISALGAGSYVSMAATASIGAEVPEYLFIADGNILWVYQEDGYARGTLSLSGPIANNDTLVINGVYYKWTSGSVDAGAPAGTVGNPWLVKLETLDVDSLYNMYAALDTSGVAGVNYSTATTANIYVRGTFYNSTTFIIRALVAGAGGNTYTTTETGANLSWGAVTLVDGGDPSLTQVQMPDDVGAIAVAYVSSYVVVIPVQSGDLAGRFYWIEPGEVEVDPLNFATAERAPDPITGVIVFKDQFWLPGTSTTEVWYFTGDPLAPVRRLQGVVYDRGAWEGTAVKVKDSMIIVDNDGRVFQITGGIDQISSPDIEQRIRQAIQFEQFTT